jgi:hypothetical protein
MVRYAPIATKFRAQRNDAMCQIETKKAATFDAVWRFSEQHTDSYVSGSDMKNVVWDRWPHHDETSKREGVLWSVGFKKLKLTALSDENPFQ